MKHLRLNDAIRSNLFDSYTVDGETFFKGQAVSFLQKCLRMDGWRFLGNLSFFERLCEENGFKIVEARNKRGNKARVVIAK